MHLLTLGLVVGLLALSFLAGVVVGAQLPRPHVMEHTIRD